MANLYELTGDFLKVQTMIENGEDGLQDTLESINLAIEDKLENIGKVIRNLDGEITAFKSEEKRLAERRRTIENEVKRLKLYAEESMKATDNRKVKAGTFTFAIQKNPPSASIVDDSLVPKSYYKQADPVLDKKLLLQALKNGESVPGAELKQSEGLRIR